MVNFIIIIGLIVLVFVFFKIKYFQHRIYIIFLVLLLLFFYTSGSVIIEKNNLDVTSFDGILSLGKLYFSWLGNLFDNGRYLVGSVVKMNWDANQTS